MMPTSQPSLAALIPARDEGRYIYEVVRRARPLVEAILVIDDGSSDSTASEARRAGAEVIRHSRSQGKGCSLQIGLQKLCDRYGYIVTLDGDLQHLPEEISLFRDEIAHSEAGLIIGSRSFDPRRMPLVRRLTNRFMSSLVGLLCGQPIPDSQSGFRALRADFARFVATHCRTVGFDFESEMLFLAARRGCQIRSVPITTCYGTETSKIRPLPANCHQVCANVCDTCNGYPCKIYTEWNLAE